MSATVSIILDTRRMKKKNGKYPVKLRVTHQRVTRNYPTIFDLSELEFKKLSASRVSEELQEVREKIQEVKRTAEHHITEAGAFEFPEFEHEFLKDHPLFRPKTFKQVTPVVPVGEFNYAPYRERFPILLEKHPCCTSLSFVFGEYIKKLLQQGRIGNAINYLRSYRSLKSFRGNVSLEAITVAYLYQYEQWMLDKDTTKTTIGIVLCPLRAVFNEAIEMGWLKRDKHYPFGRRKYQIPGSRNIKKALDVGDIRKIYYYEPADPLLKMAKDLWLFCFLANGMNVKDMLYLKYKNLQGEYLTFERAKTERTARGSTRPITIYLTEDLLQILERNGGRGKGPNDYLFPFMRPGLTLLEQFDHLNFVRGFINRSMAKICKALGVEKKVTTIVSRHTFSTHLKRAGASTEFIQEALGHTDKKTTEHYLDSFEKDVKKEFALKLVAFKNAEF